MPCPHTDNAGNRSLASLYQHAATGHTALGGLTYFIKKQESVGGNSFYLKADLVHVSGHHKAGTGLFAFFTGNDRTVGTQFDGVNIPIQRFHDVLCHVPLISANADDCCQLFYSFAQCFFHCLSLTFTAAPRRHCR